MNNILIVVDIQNDFVDGTLGTNEAVAVIPKAVQKINEFNGDIIVTMDTHFDDYLSTPEGKKLSVPHCIKGTDGWELTPDIKSALNGREYITIEKTTFGSLELPRHIKDGNANITLIGLCTDICVISNAIILKNAFPNAEITVDSTCCAGVTPRLHQSALDTMASCQINII